MKVGKFFGQKHKEEFYKLLIQSDIIEDEQDTLHKVEQIKVGSLLNRQIVFLYILALYQEDFLYYEGEKFWVESYEDLSLDGPTYLLEDKIGKSQYDYERAINIGKHLLKGESVTIEDIPYSMRNFIEQAINMLN